MIKKRRAVLSAVILCTASLLAGGCTAQKQEKLPTVALSVWGDERTIPLLEEGVAEFQKQHQDEVKLDCKISKEGEDTCRDTVLSDPDHAADIFSFADDQFDDLYQAGMLLEITEDADEVMEASGGKDTAVGGVVTRDGKLYAYPQTAGNGYFLYYNKAYLQEDDIGSLDRILEIAAQNKKGFGMEYGNGWYIYSFFQGAGLELHADESGKRNVCSWNAADTEYTGVDVAKAMLRIAADPGFSFLPSDDSFVSGVQDGSLIAGINGAWNASYVEEAWGDDYGAAKLPTYTLAGDQVQMCSFAGYKLMGINAHTEHPEWCMKLAEYLTNEENQLKRFELVGESPVNEKAAASDKVQNNPAVAALSEQSAYGSIQRVASPFWDAAAKFGITISGGNVGKRDLQTMLDEMTAEITEPVKEEQQE